MQNVHMIILSNLVVASIMLGAYFTLGVRENKLIEDVEALKESLEGNALSANNNNANGNNICKWDFVGYQSSKWEQLWMDNIDKWKDAPCERFNKDNNDVNSDLTIPYSAKTQVENVQTPPDYDLFSKLMFKTCKGKKVDVPIEPLVLLTRSPHACKNPGDIYTFTNKNYMVVDWEMVQQVKDQGGKVYYFDAGASLYTEGAGGASQNWFIDWIEKKGLELAGIFAWELTALPPDTVWNQIPGRLWPIYHWYNIPVATGLNEHTNPLTILKKVAKPNDFVIFKLDIDHIPTETALIDQLLKDKEASDLIDLIFWEYHVTSKENLNYWADYGHNYNQLYDIFGRLRKLGIRAHSWV